MRLEKMEFNTDILGVIREFARPNMQFVNEWVAAHRAIEKNQLVYSRRFHADIKAKLFTPEATRYMELFIPYIEAAVATNRFARVRDSFHGMTPDSEFWKQCTREAKDERRRLYNELFLMLYGPPWSDDESDDD
jgi:hypothetical protein